MFAKGTRIVIRVGAELVAARVDCRLAEGGYSVTLEDGTRHTVSDDDVIGVWG